MDGFERRKEQSKENIRKATLELFSQFGVEKVSIADIAKKAGVSQATIYNNFGSKDALAHEFVTTVVDQLVNGVQEILSLDKPFTEKISAFIQFISGAATQGPPPNADRIAFTNRIFLQADPEIKKIRDTATERMTELLLKLVQEGQAQGFVKPDISEEAFTIYFNVFMDVFPNPQHQHMFYTHPEVIQDLGTLMIYGMSGKTA